MITLLEIVHVLLAILIIAVVLIQGGENVDIAAAFGGVSQAAFGPRGAVTTLAKITWVLAALFMATSVSLAIWASKGGTSGILEKAPSKTAVPVAPPPSAPAAPAPTAPASTAPAPVKK
jgi:preprotein translocase subunit SecG